MKLVNLLGATFLSALFAVGCSSTDSSTTDGGTDAAKTDTGTAGETTPTDTGTAAETTPGDAVTDGPSAEACAACSEAQCKAEQTACSGDTECKKRLDCIAKCPDLACQNKCISDIPTTKGDDLLDCLQKKCATPCGL